MFFLYADGLIQWISNTGSNGFGENPAIVGIGGANIPISGTPAVINVTRTTNTGIGGLYAFKVDSTPISGKIRLTNICISRGRSNIHPNCLIS